MVFFLDLELDLDLAKGTPRMQSAVRVSSGPKLLTIAAAYRAVKVKHLLELRLKATNRVLTAIPASRQELQLRNPAKSTLQEESSAVVGPDLLTQSDNVTISAHFDGVATNSVVEVRQVEKICVMEIEERWDWKSERQEMEDWRFGNKKVEVWLRW